MGFNSGFKGLIYNALSFTKISGLELHVCVLTLIYQIMRTEQDARAEFLNLPCPGNAII